MSKRYTIPVEVDEHGEYYITFPDDLMDDLGWQEGDTLEWSEDIDASIILRKVEEQVEGS